MGFYDDRVLPYLLHLTMRQDRLAEYRRRLVTAAEGRVLEIGVGSGLNLPFYARTATQVIGLDPSAPLLAMANRARKEVVFPLTLLEGSAESIPLERDSVDTVVTTWTLCSIPDVSRALEEIRRVLTPSGQLLFVEHGRSTEERVVRWQDRLTPVWRHIAGGCHLNRPIGKIIEAAGFRLDRLETGYMPGPKAMAFLYEGRARVQ